MPIITLTTDWNNADYYLGALKGRIISLCPGAVVVDMSHQVDPFNALQAAFVVRNSYAHYPPGTIHIFGVNSVPAPETEIVALKYDGHFFIGTENSGVGLLLEQKPDEVLRIDKSRMPETEINSGYLYFADIVSLILEKPEHIGELYKNFSPQAPFLPVLDDHVINGSIIYIDSYNNAITNISKEVFQNIAKNRAFEILVKSNHYRVDKISTVYSEVPVGEMVTIFNSLDLLEVAIRNGNAAQLLNLSVNSVVRVKFYEKTKSQDNKLF